MKGILLACLASLMALSTGLQECVDNWQCPSLYCSEGFCAQDFMTGQARRYGEECSHSFQCNSGCCKASMCLPKPFCDVTIEQLPSLDDALEVVNQAAESVNLRKIQTGGKCEFNFQCRSNCCKHRRCAWTGKVCEQRTIGDKCSRNYQCHSSCCKAGQCYPLWMCSNAKDLEPGTPCTYNDHCKSGCCMLWKCRENDFWCSGEAPKGSECTFSAQCLTNCCRGSKCVDTYNCYNPEDYLRESDPQLALFYSFMQREEPVELEESVETGVNIEQPKGESSYHFDKVNQILWKSGVSVIVLSVLFIVAVVTWCVMVRKEKPEMREAEEYERITEREVEGEKQH